MNKKIKTFICSKKKCKWKFITMEVDEDATEITCGCNGRAREECSDE